MAVNTKVVKSRISSIKNTKKITKAMEMIAAVKMRKAVSLATKTRDYSILARQIMNNLGKSTLKHKLTEKRKPKNQLFILITSNRGLCGSYNAKVLKQATIELNKINVGSNVDVIAIGKKAAKFANQKKLNLIAVYEKLNENPKYEDIFPISNVAIKEFKNKNYDVVKVIFTNYISGLRQETESRQILPISTDSLDDLIEEIGKDDKNKPVPFLESYEYEFEPGKTQILNYILPTLVEIQVYQAVLESSASEHSSRMIAMKNASDSANEMIDDLTLEYNKARQASITQEVSEIVAGAAAM